MLLLLKTQKDTQLIYTYRSIFNDFRADDPPKARNPGMQQVAYNVPGVVQKNRGKLDLTLDSYMKSLEFSDILCDTDYYRIPTFSNIGVLRAEMNQLDRSNAYFLKTIAACEKFDEPWGATIAQSNMAANYVAVGHLQEALDLYLEALDYLGAALKLADETDNKTELVRLLKDIGDAHAQNGQYQEAYSFKGQHFEPYDSIFQKEKVEQINELEVRFQTAQREAAMALQGEEINTLNEKAKVDKLTKGLYAGGMFSFLAISGGLYFGIRPRMKKNRIAREKQEAIYRQEIEHKKKELANQTLHLVQKNTFLEELQENLENLRKSPEKFKMKFRRIAKLLRKEKASDTDWETFKTYFAQVHNIFDQKLKTFSSDILEMESRLAAFIRMNLTTKEIAATLNVLPESILKSRCRLKKKLGLDKETDLTEFLNTL